VGANSCLTVVPSNIRLLYRVLLFQRSAQRPVLSPTGTNVLTGPVAIAQGVMALN